MHMQITKAKKVYFRSPVLERSSIAIGKYWYILVYQYCRKMCLHSLESTGVI